MARRIKEDPEVHRKRIADAAELLFEKNGIHNTSMDIIAKKAGYSKATLYVYFRNKEEIVGYLVLSSMLMMKECISGALEKKNDLKEKYMGICQALVSYQKRYPFYFSMVLDYINIDFEKSACIESEMETFWVGEEINTMLTGFFMDGIKKGEFREQTNVKEVILAIWGMLSGLIQIAEHKKEYIAREIGETKEQFLNDGFLFLYRTFCKRDDR